MSKQRTEGVATSTKETNPSSSLSGLLSSNTYGELMEFQEPFDMFKAMRHHIGENESSAIIRFLVSDRETHGLGTQFLRSWLDEIRGKLKDNCEGLPPVDFEHVTAEVEWLTSEARRLDILICLEDSFNEPVAWIGVENKHWAIEQDKQVEDYQKALAKRANGLPSCVLFLTPSGKDPETGVSPWPECPWLAVSYATLLEAIQKNEMRAPSDVRTFLASFRNHLADNLHHFKMTDTTKSVKQKIHELFQDPEHRKAVMLLEKYRPQGFELAKQVEATLGWEAFKYEKFPWKGKDLREAKWLPPSLMATVNGTDVSVYYMLSSGKPSWEPGVSVQVAVMAWCEGVSEKEEKRQILKELSIESFEEDWWWSCWAPVWVGEKHELSDLQSKDIDGLAELLREAYAETHDWLSGNIDALGWRSEKRS
jgi:hypothetical protein